MHSADYKYTGEWTLYAGILGSEEELNNYESVRGRFKI